MKRTGTKDLKLKNLMPIDTENIVKEAIKRCHVTSCGTSYIIEDFARLKVICKELDIPFSTPIQIFVKVFVDFFGQKKNYEKIKAYINKTREDGLNARINKQKAERHGI